MANNKSPQEETNHSGDKIGIAETVILVLIALSGDLAEIGGDAISAALIGFDFGATAFLGTFFGYISSAILFMWSLLRGAKNGKFVKAAAKRTLIIFFGDIVGGALPLRTVTLIISIVIYNNADKIKKVAGVAGAAQKIYALKKGHLATAQNNLHDTPSPDKLNSTPRPDLAPPIPTNKYAPQKYESTTPKANPNRHDVENDPEYRREQRAREVKRRLQEHTEQQKEAA